MNNIVWIKINTNKYYKVLMTLSDLNVVIYDNKSQDLNKLIDVIDFLTENTPEGEVQVQYLVFEITVPSALGSR